VTGEALRILVVDDEQPHAETLAEALSMSGYSCRTAYSGAQALALLETEPFDILVTDLVMKRMDGIELLERAKERFPLLEAVVVTGYSSIETAVNAMQRGATTYLRKPVNLLEMREVIRKVAEKIHLVRSNMALTKEIASRRGLEDIVGSSKAMEEVFDRVRQVAPSNSRVLITGESGVGKELVAKAIHSLSHRGDARFVPLNCAALSEGVIESELFGHEKGAFTGAQERRKGRFAFAHGGTLFLDEVAEMPQRTQVKLLRAIEEGEIYPVGSNQPVKVDVRILAATNRDVEEELKAGRFRQDLFFRLNVVRIEIPPLRSRPSDIPLLVNHFVRIFSQTYGKEVAGVSVEARRVIRNQEWPGNVRELRNCIENMVVMARGTVLEEHDIPTRLRSSAAVTVAPEGLAGLSLREVERILIEHTLAMTDGNREEAARILKIGERTLYRKIKEYGLGGVRSEE
jgi:two-component system response regulator HydG